MSFNGWFFDIKTMHGHYGFTEKVAALSPEQMKELLKLRTIMLREELQEFEAAETPEDRVDALIDLCVFAIGTLDQFGVDAEKAWDQVMIANMTKEVGVKEGRTNPFGLPDLVKDESWEPPDHSDNTGRFKEVCE